MFVFVVLVAIVALGLAADPSAPVADADKSKVKTGGRAVAHHAGGKRTAAPNAPTAVARKIGQPAREPTLGLTRKGDIFYSALETNFVNDVLHSTNGGRTWKNVSPKIGERNRHFVSFDPYVYVDERTERLYTIDLTVACSYLSFSEDKGETWTTNPLACGRPVNDHQTLFAGPPSITPIEANILYYCWNDVGSSSCSKSVDGGLSFSPTGSPAFPGGDPNGEGGFFGTDELCGGLHGHGVVDDEGTVYLPREYCSRPYLGISKDEGLTWTRVMVADIRMLVGATDPSVDVDKKGNIYYAFVGANGLPYLVTSKDGGETWSKLLMIGAPGITEANLATLDVGKPGSVAIVYMASENSPYQDCKDECDTALYQKVTWNGYMTMTADALAKSPVFYSGTVNHASDPVKRGRCGPGRCGNQVLDFLDVVVGFDGVPYGAFVDACTQVCAGPTGLADLGNDGLVGMLVGGPSLR
ncbi:MAG: hypothetical protein ACRDKB_00025 [Actinomycetota bacterium]